MKDLKQVYQENTEEQAMSQLAAFSENGRNNIQWLCRNWDLIINQLRIMVSSEE